MLYLDINGTQAIALVDDYTNWMALSALADVLHKESHRTWTIEIRDDQSKRPLMILHGRTL